MTADQISRIACYERMKKRLTLEQVGEKAGYAHQTVSNFLRGQGKHNIQFFSVVCILEALGLELVVRRKKGENADAGQ